MPKYTTKNGDILKDGHTMFPEDVLKDMRHLQRKALGCPDATIAAAEKMDWGQVVMNGGPPCFHLEEERGQFCGRAERWDGHADFEYHDFVSLADLLRNGRA